MLKRVLVLLLPLAVSAAALSWLGRTPAGGTHLLTVEVTRGPFVAKISETGELRALESVTISAEKDQQIIYLVPEGTFVKTGDVLVRFDPGRYEAALEESKAALQVALADLRRAIKEREVQRERQQAELARFEAEVRLAQLDLDNLKRKPLKDEVERARIELEKARLAFETAKAKRELLPELVARGFVTRGTLDEAEAKYLEAKAALQAAEFSFEKVSAGAAPEELERAEIRLAQARVALERARAGMKSQLQSLDAAVDRERANVERARSMLERPRERLKRMELRAPRDGLVVYARAGGEKSSEKIQLGMIPFEGQPLIYLPDVSTMVVDTEVNEVDIGKVAIGTPVEVRLEAYPETVFPGRVIKIGSLAKVKQGRGGPSSVKVFDVTVKIEARDPRLKPGLTAALDIIVERQEAAIAVPLVAVASRGGEPVVYVADGERVEARRVVLGASNERSVVVKEGLSPGERVVLNPGAAEAS